MDISPPFPLDPEGMCRTFYFFEHTSAYPFLAFRPSKSSEDFTTSVDLLRDYIRFLCPGTSLTRLCGDYDPTWVVAGRPDNILNAHVRAHADAHNYTIVLTPPYTQFFNLAEPNIRRLAAFAFANAVRANLNLMTTYSDMYRGAQAQSRLNLVDTPLGRMTRHQALTGRTPDVSSFAGPPGCLAWAFEPDAKATAGRIRAVSCIYLCPHPIVAGHVVRVWGSRKLRITRTVTVVRNFNTRALLGCLAQESLPRAPLADPAPTTYSNCVTRLLLAYPHISDVQYTHLTPNPTSDLRAFPSRRRLY
jgi:hypothetical protein